MAVVPGPSAVLRAQVAHTARSHAPLPVQTFSLRPAPSHTPCTLTPLPHTDTHVSHQHTLPIQSSLSTPTPLHASPPAPSVLLTCARAHWHPRCNSLSRHPGAPCQVLGAPSERAATSFPALSFHPWFRRNVSLAETPPRITLLAFLIKGKWVSKEGAGWGVRASHCQNRNPGAGGSRVFVCVSGAGHRRPRVGPRASDHAPPALVRRACGEPARQDCTCAPVCSRVRVCVHTCVWQGCQSQHLSDQ